jgi:hypothetical protein
MSTHTTFNTPLQNNRLILLTPVSTVVLYSVNESTISLQRQLTDNVGRVRHIPIESVLIYQDESLLSGTTTTDRYNNEICQHNSTAYPDIVKGNAVRPGTSFQTRGGGTRRSGLTEYRGLSVTPLIGPLETYSALSGQTAYSDTNH